MTKLNIEKFSFENIVIVLFESQQPFAGEKYIGALNPDGTSVVF